MLKPDDQDGDHQPCDGHGVVPLSAQHVLHLQPAGAVDVPQQADQPHQECEDTQCVEDYPGDGDEAVAELVVVGEVADHGNTGQHQAQGVDGGDGGGNTVV